MNRTASIYGKANGKELLLSSDNRCIVSPEISLSQLTRLNMFPYTTKWTKKEKINNTMGRECILNLSLIRVLIWNSFFSQ